MADTLFKLEQDIATLLVEKLEQSEMTLDRASQIAKFVLVNLPENLTEDQIKQIIPKLDDAFFELAEVVNKYIIEFEEVNKDKIVQTADELIKQGHFDEAHKLLKGYFAKRKELVS